jgi:hypothetical protein
LCAGESGDDGAARQHMTRDGHAGQDHIENRMFLVEQTRDDELTTGRADNGEHEEPTAIDGTG